MASNNSSTDLDGDAGSFSSLYSKYNLCAASVAKDGCIYAPTCNDCLSKSRCAVEIETGSCVLADEVPSTLFDKEYFWAGTWKYCNATDPVCDDCLSGPKSANKTVCVNEEEKCFCASECSVRFDQPPLECSSGTVASFSYDFLIIGLLFPIMLILKSGVYRNSGPFVFLRRLVSRDREVDNTENNTVRARTTVEHPVPLTLFRDQRQRRQPSEYGRLGLENWREQIDHHDVHFRDVEVGAFYSRFGDEDDARRVNDAANGRRPNGAPEVTVRTGNRDDTRHPSVNVDNTELDTQRTTL